MQIYWSGSTRFHNWYDKNRTIPRYMLSKAKQTGIIGDVDWVAIGPYDEPMAVERDDFMLERLLDHHPRRGELYRIAAGGDEPISWRMTLGLFQFQKSRGQVEGYNILNFWFDSKKYSSPEGSDSLVRVFREINTPDNTEFASVHPYDRRSALQDTLSGEYGRPVTLRPLFSGVYWANFIGRKHLELFNLTQLRELKAYQVEWEGEDGLFLRVTHDLRDATSAVTEREMFRLTEQFRMALR